MFRTGTVEGQRRFRPRLSMKPDRSSNGFRSTFPSQKSHPEPREQSASSGIEARAVQSSLLYPGTGRSRSPDCLEKPPRYMEPSHSPTASPRRSNATCGGSTRDTRPAIRAADRFILDRRHFDPEWRCVKWAAFDPPASGRLSLFRTTDWSETGIWQVGNEVVGAARHRPILARGDFLARVAMGLGLRVESNEPPLGHAEILGWPDRDASGGRSAQKLIALRLADATRLELPPATPTGHPHP